MKRRVLVVDDNQSILDGLARILGDQYEVHVADGGVAGLKSLKRGKYDLILLDLLMPDIDGARFVDELRHRKVRAPVLIMSASAALADRAQELGVAGCVAKPFDVDALELAIERTIGGKQRSS